MNKYEDNLIIKLINKDKAINALIPIMCKYSIEPDVQDEIILCLLNIKEDIEEEVKSIFEKATPKKVRRALHIANGYKHCCPICSSYVGTISKVGRIDEDDYCPTCGQALDWSEEE